MLRGMKHANLVAPDLAGIAAQLGSLIDEANTWLSDESYDPSYTG